MREESVMEVVLPPTMNYSESLETIAQITKSSAAKVTVDARDVDHICSHFCIFLTLWQAKEIPLNSSLELMTSPQFDNCMETCGAANFSGKTVI